MASTASKITPAMFTDGKFTTAEEKCKRMRALTRFIEGGYKWSQFTKGAYDACHQSFDCIAHYNRLGFHEHYFTDGDEGIEEFNAEMRRYVAQRQRMDADRNSDMAALLAPGGMLAHLIGNDENDEDSWYWAG